MARSKIARSANDEARGQTIAPGSAAMPKPKKRSGQRSGEVPANSQVYASIKRQLLDGLYATGTWLPVDDLAREFGVSRQPVMDAIKRLTIEGFVEIVPQVGSRIRQHSTDDVKDFFDFFALGESYIARTAALRADADDILELRLVSAQLSVLPRINKPPSEVAKLYRALNRKLHSQISQSAKSPILAEMVEGLRDRADFFITSYASVDDRLLDALSEHEAIIDAIEQRKSDEAANLMRTHVLAFSPAIP